MNNQIRKLISYGADGYPFIHFFSPGIFWIHQNNHPIKSEDLIRKFDDVLSGSRVENAEYPRHVKAKWVWLQTYWEESKNDIIRYGKEKGYMK